MSANSRTRRATTDSRKLSPTPSGVEKRNSMGRKRPTEHPRFIDQITGKKRYVVNKEYAEADGILEGSQPVFSRDSEVVRKKMNVGSEFRFYELLYCDNEQRASEQWSNSFVMACPSGFIVLARLWRG